MWEKENPFLAVLLWSVAANIMAHILCALVDRPYTAGDTAFLLASMAFYRSLEK